MPSMPGSGTLVPLDVLVVVPPVVVEPPEVLLLVELEVELEVLEPVLELPV